MDDPPSDNASLYLNIDAEKNDETLGSNAGDGKEAEIDMQETALIDKVIDLVDIEYDIIHAESVLAELEALMRSNNRVAAWETLLKDDLFARFKRKLEHFLDAGRSCFDLKGDWFCAYEDNDKTRSIHGWIDPSDKKKLHYKIYAQIPTNLANVLAIANEVELMPEWNTLVVGKPEVIGRRTAHYMILNYQMSLLGGMQKLDILNEIRRFSDPSGGFVAEYIQTVPEGHPAHKAASSGYKRPKQLVKNMWVACGPNHTVLIQAGKLDLPISITQWWACKIAGVIGRLLIGGLVKNSMRPSDPSSPWAEPVREDRLGLYTRLQECVQSAESSGRAPKAGTPDKVDNFDLRPWFDRRCSRRISQG